MAKSGRPKADTSVAVTVSEEKKTPETVTEKAAVEEKNEKNTVEKSNKVKPITFVDKIYTVENKEKAGKSVYATTGEIITFDENGKAKVGMKDAEHLSHVPGYVITE